VDISDAGGTSDFSALTTYLFYITGKQNGWILFRVQIQGRRPADSLSERGCRNIPVSDRHSAVQVNQY
jgi:hypothetical protein